MATDTKTTAERMDILINAANSLRQAAKLCSEAQKYHDSCSDYANRGANVNARMATIKAMITDISNELSELASDANMAFQFEWVAGRNGIGDIYVNSASNTVTLRYAGGTNIESSFMNALSAGDIIRLQNSTLNSQHLIVSSISSGASFAYINTPQIVTESLLSRVIKELD